MKRKRGKPYLIKTDEAGNQLYGLEKSNGTLQFFAKNKNGKLVNYRGVRSLIKKVGLGGIIGRKISERKRGKTTFTKVQHKGEIKGRK